MPKNREQITTNVRAGFYPILWPEFRKAAINCGWALGLHGSMASDMDIMAMPWTDEAKSVEELVKALSDCIDSDLWKEEHLKPFTNKPYGRVVYTLSIYSDFYVDLSIIQS